MVLKTSIISAVINYNYLPKEEKTPGPFSWDPLFHHFLLQLLCPKIFHIMLFFCTKSLQNTHQELHIKNYTQRKGRMGSWGVREGQYGAILFSLSYGYTQVELGKWWHLAVLIFLVQIFVVLLIYLTFPTFIHVWWVAMSNALTQIEN